VSNGGTPHPTARSARNPGGYRYLDAPWPLAFAHRGGAADGDENTVAAFERAIALGYRYIETDVRCTSDGVAVVFHDGKLHRLAGQQGLISELTWNDVCTIRVGGAQVVPKLDDVLDAWPQVRFNIDAKAAPVLAPLAGAIRRAGAIDRVLVAAFNDARLRWIRRELGPRLATSMGPAEVLRLRLASVAGRGMLGLTPGVPAVQVPVRFKVVPVVDRRFVRYAHQLGLQVHAWVIDEPDEIDRLLDLGVDGIMTDRIEVLRDVLRGRGLWPA
jgi:glycerophosphoryl diester phosphodiesterase